MAFQKAKIVIGFMILFALYHGAEYFVLFQYKPLVFLLIQIVFFVAAALIARWQGFNGLSAWGLGYKHNWPGQLIAGMLMGILLYGISFLISIGLQSEEIVGVSSFPSMLGPVTLFCFGNLFSSFSEDILTRGYLYKHWNKKLPVTLLVFVSAFIYLLNHIYRLADGWQTWSYLFALGLLFIIPVLLTKRLWFTGGMHWMGNTTFYITHNAIELRSGTASLTPNTILLICILGFIPLTIGVLRIFRFYPTYDTP